MDYYDPEYRRQYCRERIAQARDEYRRVQGPPKVAPERAHRIWIRSMWERMSRRSAQQAPAYRS